MPTAGPGKDEKQRAKYFPKDWRQQYVTSRNLENKSRKKYKINFTSRTT